jgi:hypothetical protein
VEYSGMSWELVKTIPMPDVDGPILPLRITSE